MSVSGPEGPHLDGAQPRYGSGATSTHAPSAGRSDSATNCGMSPSTRIPLPSHAAAAACRRDTRSASHSTRRPLALPRFGARHRIAPLSRTRPRATTWCCSLHARPNRQAHAVSRAPQCNGRLRIRPPSRATATWRSVPLRRRTVPCRHYASISRVFSRSLAAQGLEAAFAACHYPVPQLVFRHRGSDRRTKHHPVPRPAHR